ncbi:MAG: hypothetical protein UW34_C0001G0027 [Parcubacteria group bacterium GW2011_GWA2_44_15]|nr:MAG: hypothetical protein UW34_C0001G0027 [Parcubacteria group bacterium GW2011_GWA2_44_15]
MWRINTNLLISVSILDLCFFINIFPKPFPHTIPHCYSIVLI